MLIFTELNNYLFCTDVYPAVNITETSCNFNSESLFTHLFPFCHNPRIWQKNGQTDRHLAHR